MPRAYQGAKTRTYQKLYGYKNLITWQKADDLAAMVHELTLHWGPGYYRLSDQMRSAAVSVKSNIAEGYCRVSLGDYIRFCVIARGSLGELGSQIQDCERWGLVTGDPLADLLEQYGDTTFFLERLIAGLKKKQQAGDWDKSLGVKEAGASYAAQDADLPFELPEEIKDSEVLEGVQGNSEELGIEPSSPEFPRAPLNFPEF